MIGGLSVEARPMPPVQFRLKIALRNVVDEQAMRMRIGVGVNQQPCDTVQGSCPYGDAIPKLADELRAAPHVLDVAFEPRVYQVRLAPDS
jgi:hypothetical protein